MGKFCSFVCKDAWQTTQKPVTREWLYQKYVVEKLGCSAISKLVSRDPKRVYEWLVDLNIPLRKRAWKNEPDADKAYQNRVYLTEEYAKKGRSSQEIATEHGVTGAVILFRLKRHGIVRRTIAQTRKIKHWGSAGEQNPMFGLKGERSPNWKGGSTPERQSFYSSIEWQRAARTVYKRDRGKCQRCGAKPKGREDKKNFHIHHIVSFSYKRLRDNPKNLVLLCSNCHHWVHSKANVNREFRQRIREQMRLL